MRLVDMPDLEREQYYQDRVEREHREEIRAVCVAAAARIHQGLTGASDQDILDTAKSFYGWVKEDD